MHLRRMLECKKKNKLGERGEICLHVKQISQSERARRTKGGVPTESAKAVSVTTCLHVKQICGVEEEAATLNSNWSRASESMSRP